MITLERLTRRYGDVAAVEDVSMTVEPHTITTIVGTSGSGKSTLLRMVNRLVEPTSGRVLIDGRDTALEPPHLLRRRIGYVIQDLGLFPHRTVAENIATVPRLFGWEAGRIQARVEELLAAFELEPRTFGPRYPHELSGGQQQRVGVARALAAGPNLLLMDEPFGALDPILRAKAQDDLRGVQRRYGTTIILVTHDIDEAFSMGDRVAVMRGGRLLQHDRPARLVTHPADPFVATLIGTGERSLRLLSLLNVSDVTRPGIGDGPPVRTTATLRDVLAELVWRGAKTAKVVDDAGAPVGQVSLDDILARGRQAP